MSRPTLADEMRSHVAATFPASVVKGEDYGAVDAVMIDADIYGWASRADSLNALDRGRLSQAADDLERSLRAFPEDAWPYYQRILRIARLALDVTSEISPRRSNAGGRSVRR